MNYELVAFDMDGTLLDSSKRVLPSSTEAIDEAISAGKTVVICSGRCPKMVKRERHQFPSVRYAICGSGAILYDLQEDRALFETTLPHDVVLALLDACAGEDLLLEVFLGEGFLYQEGSLPRMRDYHMGVYEPLYRETGTPVPGLEEHLRSPEVRIQKLNMHLDTREARERVRSRLAGIDAEMIDSEFSSLEFSPVGVTKGAGLEALADLLGIDRAATIGVGDADNDLPMLRAAGLSVAMGNANDNVKALSDVVVADNDHDGCAEVIRRYLLADAR